MKMEYIETLEKEISDHFKEKLEEFHRRNPGSTLTESLDIWADRYSALYNTPSYMNDFVEEVLKPKFGITYPMLQESLRSEGTTFMRYVESLLRSRLTEGGIFDTEDNESEDKENARKLKARAVEDSINADEGSLDDVNDDALDTIMGNVELKDDDVESEASDSDDPEEKAKDKKAGIIKKLLGDSDIDISDEDSESLDSIMGKLAGKLGITEKVTLIRDILREKEESVIVEAISKGTGMTLEESRMALEMLDE